VGQYSPSYGGSGQIQEVLHIHTQSLPPMLRHESIYSVMRKSTSPHYHHHTSKRKAEAFAFQTYVVQTCQSAGL
jgi:hypothetical protein